MVESHHSVNEMASRSRRLSSEQKDNQHVDWCRSRLRYMSGKAHFISIRRPLGLVEI